MPPTDRQRAWRTSLSEGSLVVVAVIALFVLPALLVVAGLAMERQFERDHSLRAAIQDAYEYRTVMRSVLIDLQDAETGQRGYLLTGDRRYLDPYLKAQHRVADDLQAVAKPHPTQDPAFVARLVTLTRSKFAELATTIRLKDEGRQGEALAVVQSGVGQKDMDAARELVAAERDRTFRLMTSWNRIADASARETQRIAVLIGAVILMAFAGSAALVAYVLIQRRRAALIVAAANARMAELLRTSMLAESTSRSGHWSLSAATGERRWSAGMFSIFGLPPGATPPDFEGVLAMFGDADRETMRGQLTRALQEKSGFEIEAAFTDASGGRKHCRLKAEYVADDRGGTLIGALQDITAERQAAEALEDSERRYRTLATTSTDMIATMSPDSTVLYVSPACRRILGYDPEELIGGRTLALTHPDDVAGVLATFEGLRRAGPGDTTMAYRFRAQHKEGGWVWLEGQPRVEFDADGAPVRYQDVVREIGSRKAAEEALEASRAMALDSERRYRLLAENATDMIAQYGLDGVISYVSPGCLNVLGYEPSELMGRSTLSLIHPDDLARIRGQFAEGRSASTAEAMHTEHRVTRRDGTVIWLEGRPKLIRDEAGEAMGYHDVMRDITPRKVMEAELREARVAAEAAAHSKADFLANMSHELRTPLNSIMGFTDLIVVAPELLAETRRRAGIVRDSSRALVGIVNDILDFSKFEAEGVVLAPEPTDLPELLHSTLEIMRQQADDKGLQLTLGPVADPGPVLVDPARVRQVLFNLLGNALKFTGQGSVTLALTEAQDGQLRLSIQDTGIGIAETRLDGVFERFAQADASTSRRYGGTGLGLAICSAIVQAMGGQIGVESEEGAGSTFWFTFNPPRIAPARSEPAASLLTAPAAQSRLKGLRLLVADDNLFNRELFEALMAGHGLEITGADNGRQAVDLARSNAFDLVFMDMQMPVMDGLEATRAIRDLGLSKLPIVALTANVVPSQVALCLDAGMDDHMAKPYTAALALETIARWTIDRAPAPARAANRRPRRSAGAA